MKIDEQKILQPFKVTCAKCHGEAWAIPIPPPNGMTLCPKCTFKEPELTLIQMLENLYGEQ